MLFIASIFLTSCSSDDDLGKSITEDDLVGVWNITEFTLNSKVTTTEDRVTSTFELNSFGKDFNYNINFSKKPIEFSTMGTYTTVTTLKPIENQRVLKNLWQMI